MARTACHGGKVECGRYAVNDDGGPLSVPLLSAGNLSRRPGVAHGFTTRAGGVSRGPLGTLNLALRAGEETPALVENWRRVAAAVGRSPDDLVLLDQVHGARVLVVDAATGPLATAGAADASVTAVPGLLLAVRVADCVPVLLVAPGGAGVAHAGWRGTAAGVVPAAVAALVTLTGCAPGEVAAAIGPCISGDAYGVGAEVVDAIAASGVPPALFLRPPRRVDLAAAVEAQLRATGVHDVERLGVCTVGDPRFYSHRRDGDATGRLAGVVAWQP